MKGILLKIRVLLEGLFLWFGGLGLYEAIMIYVEPHFDSIQAEDIFHITMSVLLFAAVVWIFTERKKDLGDRISFTAYVVLSVMIPLAIGFAAVWIFINSFD